MIRRIHLLSTVLVAMGWLAPGGPVSAQAYVDTPTPFNGSVDAVVTRSGESAGKRDSGTGRARFIALGGGKSKLEVTASIRRPGDAGFTLVGGATATGWSGRTGGLRLDIDRHGRISGGGVEKGHRIRFGGTATASRMDLDVVLELLQANEAGLPAGSRIAFDYALTRDARRAMASANPNPGGSAQPAAGKKKKACRKTVWQVRNVASPGGGMTMIQTPVCVD